MTSLSQKKGNAFNASTKVAVCFKSVTFPGLKSTVVKKVHQSGTSNPTDPKGITAHSRVKEFPNNYLIIRNGKLFCSACREEIALKKATITHISSGEKHKKAKKAVEKTQAGEQTINFFFSYKDLTLLLDT